MIIKYATSSPTIQLAVAGTMATRICESLKSIVDRTLAASIQQLQAKITDLTFAVLQ